MADERSVDVDEGREPEPEQGTRRAAIAAGTRLSPVQEAYGAYAKHAVSCRWCRDIDHGRCGVGDELWGVYQEVSAEAYRRMPGL